MAAAGPILRPTLQHLRSRSRIFRKLLYEFGGKIGSFSGGLFGETDGKIGGEEVSCDGDQLRRICGVSYGENVAGKGGESGDR